MCYEFMAVWPRGRILVLSRGLVWVVWIAVSCCLFCSSDGACGEGSPSLPRLFDGGLEACIGR